MGPLPSSLQSRNHSRILIYTSVTHGEHPTRRAGLLTHAPPEGRKGGFEDRAEEKHVRGSSIYRVSSLLGTAKPKPKRLLN